MAEKHRIYTMAVSGVYPAYIAQAEVDEIICWLTGYDAKGLQKQLDKKTDFETFFKEAPKLNPKVKLITGVICGVRIEEIEDKLMKKVRYLDKLIDELAQGKDMDKILRKSPPKASKK
jgi:hypothetical protein